MTDQVRNLANAAVIIACLYFLVNGDFGFWATAGIICVLIFSIITWGIWSNPFKDQERKLIDAQINELDSRARINNSNAAFTSANALLMREQAIYLQRKR